LTLLYAADPLRHGGEQVAATLAAAQRQELSLDGLLEAQRGGRLVGAAWGRILPGRTALVWPPRLVAGEENKTAEMLLRQLDRYLQAGDVCLSQALLNTDSREDAARLRAEGYAHAADLVYLACTAEQFPVVRPRTALNFEAYRHRDRRRLAELIESTYVDTRDLPTLNGVRESDDVLDGYQQTGAFDPDRWLLVRKGQQDVGCLLMTDHPADSQWELMYMGLTPSARGRGWGLVMTRYGQWLAGQSECKRMVVAADAANEPALRIYAAAGFVACDRRRVFLKLF
jgi:RimJ/RimL family protein N-acetyltransferase